MMIVKIKNMYETAYYECTEEEENKSKNGIVKTII